MRCDDLVDEWVKVPLSHGQVYSSTRSTAGLKRGLSLTSPCNSTVLRLHREMLRLAEVYSPLRLLSHSQPPAAVSTAAKAVFADAETACGPFGAKAIGYARQSERPHFVALISTPVGELFLKSTTDASDAAYEGAVLGALGGGSERLRVPRLIASGSVAGQHWLITEAMPSGRHEPVWDFPTDDVRELATMVHSAQLPQVVERDNGSGSDFAHGDLAPWNLRHCGNQMWLVDWADGRLSVPFFDQTYFEVAATAMGAPLGDRAWESAASAAVLAVVDERLASNPSPLDFAMAALLRN